MDFFFLVYPPDMPLLYSTVLSHKLPHCRKHTTAKVTLCDAEERTPKLAVRGRKPKFHSPKNLTGFLRAQAGNVNFHDR